MAKLVHQPLGSFRLLHDALLVVLPNGPRQLVVVHGGAVFATTPQPGYPHRVFDLEDTLGAVDPADCRLVLVGGRKEFLQELPQVDVGTALAGFGRGGGAGGGGCGSGGS